MSTDLDFFNEIAALVKPTPTQVIEYRLYYDELGNINGRSEQQPHLEGNYVVVSREVYDAYYDYAIVKGEPKLIDKSTTYKTALVKSTQGHTVVKNHAALLLTNADTYTDTEIYGYRNS